VQPGQVLLLSKPDCGLCREALTSITAEFGVENVTVVNILEDRELEDRYVFRIPVLLRNDTVLAEGRINRAEARRALRRAIEQAATA
jgi:hypothetical protein